MYKISICIPTYKRPLLLKKLIYSITACNINRSLIKDYNIIIVDNDVCMTAKSVVTEIKETLSNNYRIDYHSFSVKGLSNVRNELIKNALLLNPDFIVFVDDDEHVTLEWLNELVKTITMNNGDIAMGPVISSIDSQVSSDISCWLERANYLNNTRINFIRTGNLIINANFFLRSNIWFDPRFNTTGGEDTYFGIQMMKKGASIYWAANAIVYETVPNSRANILWLIRRYYNGSIMFTNILKFEKEYIKLTKKTLLSFLYLLVGVCAIFIIPIPIKRRYYGLLKFSEGLGGIAALLNIRHHEYK
jgi:succinoglycan biosynthesis protein ExoM